MLRFCEIFQRAGYRNLSLVLEIEVELFNREVPDFSIYRKLEARRTRHETEPADVSAAIEIQSFNLNVRGSHARFKFRSGDGFRDRFKGIVIVPKTERAVYDAQVLEIDNFVPAFRWRLIWRDRLGEPLIVPERI